MIPVLTIDGPSGAGKGTVSRAVAKKLAWHYLDSGAIYRSLAIAVLKQQLAIADVSAIIAVAQAMELTFACGDTVAVHLNKVDITSELGTETIAQTASIIAAYPAVRDVLLQKQRDFKQLPGLVADGRDMGTVVFPEAQFKVYLTASVNERAKRRYKQLIEKGNNVNLTHISQEIAERDNRDRARKVAPLAIATDALTIDSSALSIDEVVSAVLNLILN